MARWNPRGSVSIVTGASSGIGRELAMMLAERGSQVVAVARRADRLDELQHQLRSRDRRLPSQRDRGRIHPVVGDVTLATTRAAAMGIADSLGEGRLDLLINNAGVGAIGRFDAAAPERLRQVMEVNFFAPAEWTREAIPRFRRAAAAGRPSPVLCNVGSVLGHRAVPDKSEYCASKFALHGLTDSLRAELAGEGITVTLVSPSTTQSEFFSSLVGTDASATSKSVGQWTPARVARATLAAIQSRRAEVILSLGGKALVYSDRFFPPVLNAILARGATPSGGTSREHPQDASGTRSD